MFLTYSLSDFNIYAKHDIPVFTDRSGIMKFYSDSRYQYSNVCYLARTAGVISAKLCTLQGIKSSLSALRSRVLSAVKNAFNVSSCINRDRSRVFRASPHNAMAPRVVEIRAVNITATSSSD